MRLTHGGYSHTVAMSKVGYIFGKKNNKSFVTSQNMFKHLFLASLIFFDSQVFF